MSDIFESASRSKVRFETRQGLLSVEDLWELSLTSLDTLAKAVNKQLKESEEESFLPSPAKRKNTVPELKLQLLKHVITVRVAEDESKKKRAENRAKREQLKQLLSQKTFEQLASQSVDDLRKAIDELGEDEE
jgi:hypothetical protein